MTNLRPIIATGEVYHIFNRTNGGERVLKDLRYVTHVHDLVDYYRFNQRLKFSDFRRLNSQAQNEYKNTIDVDNPLVEIYTFAFMSNHFHFLLKQVQPRGISVFLSNIQNSLAKYYNSTKNRTGSVFQSSFKAKIITSNEEFIHEARYNHLNPVTAGVLSFEELLTSPRTSLPCYIDEKNNRFVTTKPLLDYFGTVERLVQFTRDQEDYQKTLALIKKKMR